MDIRGPRNGYRMKTQSLKITSEQLRLIAEIDEFKGSWKMMRTLAPERLAVLRRVATIESIGSSTRIEGAKLSDAEVEKLLGRVGLEAFVNRDEQEVAGYAKAMETVFDASDSIQLTENYIKQLHSMLLQHSTKDQRHHGDYKKLANHVEAFNEEGESIGIIFETASPFETPRRMQQLVTWAREAFDEKELHPLVIIALFIVTFLEIHPLQDGNGRLSRVLTSLLLLKAGYIYVPYSSLESVIEQNKDGYYLALRRTQATLAKDEPDYEPWLHFFLRSLKAQKDNLAQRVSSDSSLEDLHPDAVLILEHAKGNGRITTGEAEKLIQAPRPTVKSRLSHLVERGLLVRRGKGRGSWYSPA